VQALLEAVVDEQDLIGSGSRRDFAIAFGQAGSNGSRTGLVSEPGRQM